MMAADWETDAETVDDILGDIWDTRDLIALVDKLEQLAEDGDEDAAEELARARGLAEELESYAPDYHYGEMVIADSYFTTYAQELAEDVGALENATSWPAYCIDWEWAARELRMDYTAVSYNGATYWVR